MKFILVSLLASLALFSACLADECDQFHKTLMWHGREYEVRFMEDTANQFAWPEDLVLRWRATEKDNWHIADRIRGARFEKEIKLADKYGHDIDALVISRAGGSAEWISIVEIRRNPPEFSTLLDNVLDKGGFKYRCGSDGRLIGFKFEYLAWHVSTGDLKGHVFTAMNVGWHPDKRKFTPGPIYVNDESEQKASLADILAAIGSDELLDMDAACSEDYTTCTYIYKPFGILYHKTPPELRSAKKVRVVLKYDSDDNPYIEDIRAVDN